MKRLLLLTALLPALSVLILSLVLRDTTSFEPQNRPTLAQLNRAISKAQAYYDGLYVDLGKDGAVMAEYYPKIKYTVRHATIGGYYYYSYVGDATKSAKLYQFAKKHGFHTDNDHHSFIWKYQTYAPEGIIYTPHVYQDCYTKLPSFSDIKPYRSKVCSLGTVGVSAYISTTKTDSFAPMINTLHRMSLNKPVDYKEVESFEKKYNELGFGIPTCTPLSCTKTASTIRTAHFGEIALRLNRSGYADSVAHSLLKAQDEVGAFYTSFTKDGERGTEKSIAYHLLDVFFNDKEAYKGDIVTNAETMNDVLAFLLHYRCTRYNSGCIGGELATVN